MSKTRSLLVISLYIDPATALVVTLPCVLLSLLTHFDTIAPPQNVS